MLNTFLNFIQQHKLFTKSQKLLVAVSGGVDSVVLVHLLHKSNHHFAIAHCNFHLRGRESDQDELFVEQLAKQLRVPFINESFDVISQSEDQRISIQMAARNARYAWFENIRSTYEYDFIATAHHRSDSLETVLFNLTKGTGLAGLHGIKPIVNHIVRPLLFASKEEIIVYARHNKLEWREDSSNSSNKYFRNLIRSEVIPTLKKINPNLEETFQLTIQRLKSTEDFFIGQVEAVKKIIMEKRDEDFWISIKALKSYDGMESVLHYILQDFGFNYVQTLQIIQSLDSRSGKMFYSPEYVLNIDRRYLVITSQADEFAEQTIYNFSKPIETSYFNLDFVEVPGREVKIDRSPDVAMLDLDKIDLPVKLRPWKHGDRFMPLGMRKYKKLSDFMIDEKIPVNLKGRIFVLTTNNNIFWIIGHRIDNRYRVTENSRKVLKIVKLPIDD